jgi:TM2 domain-containing membrane protein YozV
MDHAADNSWLASLDGTDLVAIALSLVVPGAGHIILGQTIKGLVILLAVFATLGVGLVVSVLAALDCYLLAKARKARTVGDWEFFPQRAR